MFTKNICVGRDMRRNSHKEHGGREEHKVEEERRCCPKSMRRLHDKIADKNIFLPLFVIFVSLRSLCENFSVFICVGSW